MEALTFTSTILPRTKIDTRLALASAKTRTSATRVQAEKHRTLLKGPQSLKETIGKEECLNLEGNHDAILKAGLFDQWRQRALGYEYDANRRTQSNQGIINSNVLQEAKRSQKVKSRAKAPLSPSSTSQPPGPTDELERLLALKPRPQLTYDSFMFNMNQASAYEALSRRTKTEPSSVELAWFESFIRRLEKYVEACTIHRNLYLRALREMPSALLMGCLRFQEADLEVLVADAESVVCQQPTRRRGETTPSSETDQERAWRKQFEQDFPYGPKALQTRGTGLRCAWYALQLSIKHQFPDVPVPTLHELQSIFNHLADSVHPDLQMSNSNMFRIDQAIRVGVAWLNRWNVEACVGVAYKNDDQLFYAQIPVQNFDRRLHRVLWIHNDNLSVGDWSGAHFSGLRGVTMQESEERLAPLTWSLTRADEPSTVRGWRRLTRNLAALDRHKGSYGDEDESAKWT
ncbi:hypothetical protein M406DRAFT_328953 [Cryphonectria parasitica EP155]|uniref:Uncharacterized protein n=1 Tax=Cryphonectria parasitica (strain ATCC 38755 / EP155) TaxID=660469 RepID=A0A9P4Y7D1_CRYP1|nr:uncharacterized protein M406DRAFT_328953 [Cryphonectria parasitica EP155]KAF3767903.1 hypothetical protein M406DRAFT_328953 [Cryphonectria parasitica EP155]